jgi:hypothetical protein
MCQMKKAVLILLLLIGTGSWAALSAVMSDISDDPPEFYFTRLAYSERGDGCCRHRGGGFGGFGRFVETMPIPREEFKCPEFGGGNFFPPQGWGWGIDYPGGDCKFMGGIHRLTGMRVHTNPNVVGVLDPKLFKFPFIYIVEPGGMYFSDQDAKQLREYFDRGGFLYADDFWGSRERQNFELQMRKVFPDRPIERLPLNHEIFHTFFDIPELIQIPGQGSGCYGGPTWEVPDETDARVLGITDDKGRLVVVATYNSDYGDAWEWMDLKCYPEKYSSQAYRVGLNIMIYAMTH